MQYTTFADDIHALILERGRAYFDSGAVQQLVRTHDGWSAEVAGQENYKVVIAGLTAPEEWYCECPYDHGPVCKHVAAVFFAIQAELKRDEHGAE